MNDGRGERMKDYLVATDIFYSSSDKARTCSAVNQRHFLTWQHPPPPPHGSRFSDDGVVLMIAASKTFIFSYCIPSCLSAFPSLPQREVNIIMDIDDKL